MVSAGSTLTGLCSNEKEIEKGNGVTYSCGWKYNDNRWNSNKGAAKQLRNSEKQLECIRGRSKDMH